MVGNNLDREQILQNLTRLSENIMECSNIVSQYCMNTVNNPNLLEKWENIACWTLACMSLSSCYISNPDSVNRQDLSKFYKSYAKLLESVRTTPTSPHSAIESEPTHRFVMNVSILALNQGFAKEVALCGSYDQLVNKLASVV